MIDKYIIRAKIKELKKQLSSAQITTDCSIISSIIEKSLWFKQARNILTYYSLPDEIQTIQSISNWSKYKNIYLPKVNGFDLEIIKYNKSLNLGAFNIYEPIGPTENINTIDLIIVPGIAFDKQGNRLGRGKGYYDRLLSKSSSLKIGIGYDFQIFDRIATESHDIPMDAIITPSHTLIINQQISWQ